MNETVLQRIKRHFAELQVKVRSAMEEHGVKVIDVHQYLVSVFCADIPETSELTKLFNFVTKSQLWRYDHYLPLKEFAIAFLPADNPARKHVIEYQSQYSGFLTTTKIIEYINLSELEDSKDDKSPQDVDYHKLAVTLKLGRKVKLSDLSMSYVDELWRALIDEFNLPPLTAVLKKIVGGSLVIEWLVTMQVSAVVRESCSKALVFYQQRSIVYVVINREVLYNEEWIVSRCLVYLHESLASVLYRPAPRYYIKLVLWAIPMK